MKIFKYLLIPFISLAFYTFSKAQSNIKFVENAQIYQTEKQVKYLLLLTIPAGTFDDSELEFSVKINPSMGGKLDFVKQTINSKNNAQSGVTEKFIQKYSKNKSLTFELIRYYSFTADIASIQRQIVLNTEIKIFNTGKQVSANKGVVKLISKSENSETKIRENEVSEYTTPEKLSKDTVKTSEKEKLPTQIVDIENEISKYKNTGDNKKLSELYKQLGEQLNTQNDYKKAREAFEKAIEFSEKNNDNFTTGTLYSGVGEISYNNNDNIQAVSDYKNAAEYYESVGKTEYAEQSYNNLAVIYNSMAFYQNAVDSYEEALKRVPENDKQAVAKYNSKIAEAYRKMKNLQQAAEHYELALNAENSGKTDNPELVSSLNNISSLYTEMGEYEKAKSYREKAIEIKEKSNEKDNSKLYNSLGNINFLSGNKDKALADYMKAVENPNDKTGRSKAIALHNIGKIYFQKNDFEKAREYFVQSIEIAEKMKFTDIVSQGNFMLSEIIAKNASCKDDFNTYKNLLSGDEIQFYDADKPLSDITEKYEVSISKAELMAQLSEKDAELKKQLEIAEKQTLKNKLLEVDNRIRKEENQRQKTMIFILLAGLLLFIIITTIAVRQYLLKKKANNNLIAKNAQIMQQSEEIRAQAEELLDKNEKITLMNTDLSIQKKEIEDKNSKITASITYAQNIQNAILPNHSELSRLLSEHFVVYFPRDIISGDFYWTSEIEPGVVIAVAADCTGHGVPGAMMSMLGVALLNEIIVEKKIHETGEILDKLREMIIKSLGNTEKSDPHAARDGMDLALMKIDKNTMKLSYSGARNPLILVRNNEITEFKADNMPVGDFLMSENAKNFTIHQTDIQKGDLLYAFSDGFPDQIGGDKKRKYFSKNMQSLFLKISNLSMTEQKNAIEKEFNDWKGNTKQIDDVLVMGIRI